MTTPRPRRTTLALGAALLAAGLSGCGALQPGAAVTVGDDSISMNEVDEVTADYCDAVTDQLTSQGQVVPGRFFRGGIAGTLAVRAVAEQLAEDYDVEPGAAYQQTLKQVRRGAALLDEEQRDAVVQVQTATAYVEGVETEIGRRLLENEGVEDADASQALQRGQDVLDEWVTEHQVEFDPRLGVQLVDGEIQPADTSLSYPVSNEAVDGSAEEPNPEYAAALPESHRCGG